MAKKTNSQEQQPSSVIKDYLQRTNRPYSATDLHNNLKQSIPKSQILKALQDLVETQVICQKTYGKQSVFVFNQQDLHFDADELQDNLKSINELSSVELPELKRSLVALSTELSSVTAQPTTVDARERLRELNKKISENEQKLLQLSNASSTPLLSPDELKKLDVELVAMQQLAKKRKRIFKDIINCMTEAADIAPKVLMEELGIESIL